MKILLINNKTRFLQELSDFLKSSRCKLTVKGYNKIHLKDVKNKDAIIISGGNEKIKELKIEREIIKKTRIPVLGICLGFQLICCIFGGHMERMSRIERGIIKIKVEKRDKIFNEIKKNLRVFEDHKHDINNVGKNLVVLAKSKDGIEIVKHRKKLIYGIQFHPEIIKNNDGYKILENFLAMVK